MSSSRLLDIAHIFSVAGKSVEDLAAYREAAHINQPDNTGTYESTPELEHLQRLAGVDEIRNDHEKSIQADIQERSAIVAEKKKIEKEQNIETGTDEWFKLWFGDAR
jgi:hypothetical protein